MVDIQAASSYSALPHRKSFKTLSTTNKKYRSTKHTTNLPHHLQPTPSTEIILAIHTSRHFSTITNGLSEEETEADFVQPQFPILIRCSLQLRLCSWPSKPSGLTPYSLTN